MKKIGILLVCTLLALSCSAQDKEKDKVIKEKAEQAGEVPGGTWKVDKEFDENGNLIRYDSIYSWSSSGEMNNLDDLDKDSTLQSFRSKFYRQFSNIDRDRFGDMFGEDSLFTRHFFNEDFFDSDFGQDFMDIDRIRERMEAMQRRLLNRYAPEVEKSKRDSVEVN